VGEAEQFGHVPGIDEVIYAHPKRHTRRLHPKPDMRLRA